MPVIQFPRRALPARFRRTTVLIVGCGDVGQRIARQLQAHVGRYSIKSDNAGNEHNARRPRVVALTSSADKAQQLRDQGITPVVGNLDVPRSLRRLRGLAQRVVHMAPPPGQGVQDTRTANLLRVLRQGRKPLRLVYGSTTGVYGDCAGAWLDETRAVNPSTDRARRRVNAEQRLLQAGRSGGASVQILRIPGIYAPDREGGTPQWRLLKGLPVLERSDDVFTNHIHADDLACIAIAALWRGQPQRIYHACDDTELRMGDYFDVAADIYGLPRPQRISCDQAQQSLPPMMLSFMGESRRLRNRRIKQELRVQLRWPTVDVGLRT